MEAFDAVIEEAESMVEQNQAPEGESMFAKREESSLEASSSEEATRWKCHERDIVGAHILVQIANEDFGLLRERSNLHRVKHNLKGIPRMRWGERGHSYSEVDGRRTKFLAKGRQATLRGQMNDGDGVVLALRAVSCDERRKHRKRKIGMGLSSCRPKYYNISEDKDDYLHERRGVWDVHESTNRWGKNYQKSIVASLEDPHHRLGVSRIKKRKTVKISSFSRETEDVQKIAYHVGSLPAPPLGLMEPRFNTREWFIGMRGKMNIATISLSSKEVRAHFHKEEALRYLVPCRGFFYTALDGRKSAVAPMRRTKNAVYHVKDVILKPDRPRHIYVMCLVRDAAARLPGGIGTRSDICTLMRDSQYLAEDISDEQLKQVASKALERLQHEVDPCVKYDRKLWVYLHRNRGENDFDNNAASWSNASLQSRK